MRREEVCTDKHPVDEKLSAYLEGELSQTESDEIERHLGMCLECRSVLSELRAIREAAAGLEEIQPSPTVWLAVRDRIGTARPRTDTVLSRAWPAVAAGIILVIAVLLLRSGITNGGRKGVIASTAWSHKAAGVEAVECEEYINALDEAIEECEAALAENPQSFRVQYTYLSLVSSQLSMVNRLSPRGGR